MMRRSVIALAAAFMVLVVIAFIVSAAESQPAKEPMGSMGHEMGQPPAGNPPAGAPPRMTQEEMMRRRQEAMKKMGMSEGMLMRHKIMYSVVMAKNDPASVLALKDDLALTPDQVKKIDSIAAKAREETEAVLTAEQKKKLEPLAGTPETMMGMQEEMRSKMGEGGMIGGPMMGGPGGRREGGAMGGPGGRGAEGGGTGRMRMGPGASPEGAAKK